MVRGRGGSSSGRGSSSGHGSSSGSSGSSIVAVAAAGVVPRQSALGAAAVTPTALTFKYGHGVCHPIP